MAENVKRTSFWSQIYIDFSLLVCILALLGYSMIILWSASGQNIDMMERRLIQIGMGLAVMFVMAQISPRIYESWSPYLYLISLLLLLLVDIMGYESKGAQRWLDLGVIRFQPSEIAKITVPLMVARFINRDGCPPSIKNIFVVLFIIIIPTLLVAAQPDLGTAILIALSGLFILFLAGMSWRFISASLLSLLAFLPVLWFYLLLPYQRARIMTFLHPEDDKLGASWHITQSKIAIGSGGIWGKGWLAGTQSNLEFLPERHTDFIFSVLAEEMGMFGELILLMLYLCLITRGLIIAMNAQTAFGRILAGGLTLILCVYLFVNIGMVSGILPVVGVPLPFISYGGSALIVLMAGFGIIMSIHTHRKMLSKSV